MPAPRLLLAATGSVAAVKVPLLVSALVSAGVDVRLVVTKSACHFLDLEQLTRQDVRILTDADEWTWRAMGDPVLHIELRNWADAMVIAPLDANTLAKLAGGMCDNLLTCIVRAWDLQRPLFLCPAMNTRMWEHPLTRRHLDQLSELGYREVAPVVKRLACGDVGGGAMAEVETIVETVLAALPSS